MVPSWYKTITTTCILPQPSNTRADTVLHEHCAFDGHYVSGHEGTLGCRFDIRERVVIRKADCDEQYTLHSSLASAPLPLQTSIQATKSLYSTSLVIAIRKETHYRQTNTTQPKKRATKQNKAGIIKKQQQ